MCSPCILYNGTSRPTVRPEPTFVRSQAGSLSFNKLLKNDNVLPLLTKLSMFYVVVSVNILLNIRILRRYG